MRPELEPPVVVMQPQLRPHRRLGLAVLACAAVLLAPLATGAAQPRKDGNGGKPADQSDKGDKPARSPGDKKPKVMDFTGIDISGRLRTPQLLYFLDRAAEELDRASLERRSFIPEMVRSIDEEEL